MFKKRDFGNNALSVMPPKDDSGPFTKCEKSSNFLHKMFDYIPRERKINTAVIAIIVFFLSDIILNMPKTIRTIKGLIREFKEDPKTTAIILVVAIICGIASWSKRYYYQEWATHEKE